MTVGELIEKLSEYPKDKELIILCKDDVFDIDNEWNRAFTVETQESDYIEYNSDAYYSLEELEKKLSSRLFSRKSENDKIVSEVSVMKVVRMDIS